RPQQLTRRSQICAGVVEMFQHVKHGDRSAAQRAKRSRLQCGASGRRVVQRPGHVRRLARKIETHRTKPAVLQHPQKKAAAATHIEYRSAYAGFRSEEHTSAL